MRPLEPAESRCLRCGEPEVGRRSRCAACGASLLVDVVLSQPLAEERERFHLARDLALLGPPAPAFSEARRALEQPEGRVLQGVSRAFAHRVLGVLAHHGVEATLQPAAAAPARLRRWGPPAVVLAAVLAWGLVLWGWRQAPAPAPSAVAGPASVPAGSPEELSTEEVARRASPGTVSLRCGDKEGAGFFVDFERVLTNAHVVCPPDQAMLVRLADGRQLLGFTLERDDDLDLATVRVAGAEGSPLPLGDATLLAPGNPVVLIGSPEGLAFTVHQGRVSFVGREYLGVGYVQFDATVNPGNSGGPLLNARGEVVGVVSFKVLGEGIGLALPIKYAQRLVPVPGSPEAELRWQALLRQVAREEERALERYRFAPGRPALVGVEESPSVGLVALVLERFGEPPGRVTHRFELEAEASRCTLEVAVEHWRPLLEAAARGGDGRRLRWLVTRGLTQGLYLGAVVLPVERCTLPEEGQGWLKVAGGAAHMERFPLSLQAAARARQPVPAPKASP